MLLSAYFSYRLAKGAMLRSRMLDLAFFVVLVSLFSVYFPAGDILWFPGFLIVQPWLIFWVFPYLFLLPLPFLSWPAYSWYLEFHAPEWVGQQGFYWVWYRGVSFLSLDVFSTPDWKLLDGSLLTNFPWSLEQNFAAFSFFLLVNVLGVLLGAFLGYWMGRGQRVKRFEAKWWTGVIGVICVVISFIVAGVTGQDAGIVVFGLGIILVGIVLFMPLIKRLARMHIATLIFLGGSILWLTGELIKQNLVIGGGRILVLSSAIIYVAQFAIAYERAHKITT